MIKRDFFIIVTVICSQIFSGSCYDRQMALQLGYMSAVAYQSVSSINSWTCSYCKRYDMKYPSTFYNSSDSIQGFAAYNPRHNAIVVSFRGSQNMKNWIVNLNTSFSKYSECNNCKVHSGFLGAYESIAAQMKQRISNLLSAHEGIPIFVTGHSLGGALALLAAIDIKHMYNLGAVYTFGSPRVGNSNLARYINGLVNAFRVIHYNDVVPHMPPKIFGFVHAANEIWYSKGMISYQHCTAESPNCANSIPFFFSVSNHDLDKYLQLKVQTVGSIGGSQDEKFRRAMRNDFMKRFSPTREISPLQQEKELRMVNEALEQLGGFPLVKAQ